MHLYASVSLGGRAEHLCRASSCRHDPHAGSIRLSCPSALIDSDTRVRKTARPGGRGGGGGLCKFEAKQIDGQTWWDWGRSQQHHGPVRWLLVTPGGCERQPPGGGGGGGIVKLKLSRCLGRPGGIGGGASSTMAQFAGVATAPGQHLACVQHCCRMRPSPLYIAHSQPSQGLDLCRLCDHWVVCMPALPFQITSPVAALVHALRSALRVFIVKSLTSRPHCFSKTASPVSSNDQILTWIKCVTLKKPADFVPAPKRGGGRGGEVDSMFLLILPRLHTTEGQMMTVKVQGG